MRYRVTEVATEKVTYLHTVEADSPEAAERIVLDRATDEGTHSATETEDRAVVDVQEV